MRFARIVVVAIASLASACMAEEAQSDNEIVDLQINSEAVEIAPGKLKRLRLRGTRVLTAETDHFGGFSGLLVRDGRMKAVTDAGWLLEAPLVDGSDGLEPGLARMVALTDPDGALLDKSGGDAEGLAVLDGRFFVSFERDHRIMEIGEGAQLQGLLQYRAFETLGSNKGLESLATLPDRALIAIAEASGTEGHPVFVLEGDELHQGTLVEVAPYSVTGADVGPDGLLYLVQRYYSPLTGVRIRIDRMALTEEGFPLPGTRQLLAEYESGSGIDNMEGISVWTDAQGRLRLALISDDNFNFVQRTLLMDFELTD